ncbi:MAG TPA: NAD(P)-dependent oxidoreductase, partial [Paludibacteraceae bacterium]|nr:NAD(P)-dependent oxidoreductase [Paludibacteraceae bacterium]
FAKIMLGFGCKVIAFDPTESDDAKQLGIQYVALEDVLKQADILSLHCPLNQHTRHMISTKEFSIMKHGAMLINTSRGALIDTKEAIEALKTGALGYLGIDVYEEEEKLFFHDFSESIISDDILMRLMTFPNVLITSHQAFFTHEALTQIAETTYQNMLDFTHGTSSTNQLL